VRLERVLIIRGDSLEELGVDARADTNGVDLDTSILDGLCMRNRVTATIGNTISEHDENLGCTALAVLENRVDAVKTSVHVGGRAHLRHGGDTLENLLLIVGERELGLGILGELDESDVDSLRRDGGVGGKKRSKLHQGEVSGGDGTTAINQETNVDGNIALGGLALSVVGLENTCRRVIGIDVLEGHGGDHTNSVLDGTEDGIRLMLLSAEGPVEHGELHAPDIAGLTVDSISAIRKSKRRNHHGAHILVEEAASAFNLTEGLINDVTNGSIEIADINVLSTESLRINTVLLLISIPIAVTVHGEGHHAILNGDISFKSPHFRRNGICTDGTCNKNKSNTEATHYYLQ